MKILLTGTEGYISSLLTPILEVFLSRGFTRLKQLEYLLHTQQIDRNFLWN